jgi:hypothetical protein
MQKKWIAVACLVVAIALLPGASVASAESKCNSGHACVWPTFNFIGRRVKASARGAPTRLPLKRNRERTNVRIRRSGSGVVGPRFSA